MSNGVIAQTYQPALGFNVGRTLCNASVPLGQYYTTYPAYVNTYPVSLCACAKGTALNVSQPTVISQAPSILATANPHSVAMDASGTIWFNQMAIVLSGYSLSVPTYIGGQPQLLAVSPPYTNISLTGISDCSYVWSNVNGSVFYFSTSGKIKQVV